MPPEGGAVQALSLGKGGDPARVHRNAQGARLSNRITSALVRLGIRGFKPMLKKAAERLETLRTPEGSSLPPNTLEELRRDVKWLARASDCIVNY